METPNPWKTMFSSREFILALVTVLVIVIQAFVPMFQMDKEVVTGLVLVVASYIIGTAADPGTGDWRGVLRSRKFITALVGLGLAIANGFGLKLPEGIPDSVVIEIAIMLAALIAGYAVQGALQANVPKG